MTDERRRKVERSWKATASIEDESLMLRERVRRGEMTAEQLAVAAHCGHPAALRCLQAEGQVAPQDLDDWVSGCVVGGRPAAIRIAMFLARRYAVIFDRRISRGRQAQHLIRCVEAYLASPCVRQATKARRAYQKLDQARADRSASAGWSEPFGALVHRLMDEPNPVLILGEIQIYFLAHYVTKRYVERDPEAASVAEDVCEQRHRELLRTAICEDLLVWALTPVTPTKESTS